MKPTTQTILRRYKTALKSINSLKHQHDLLRMNLCTMENDRDLYRNCLTQIYKEIYEIDRKNDGNAISGLWLMKYITERVARGVSFIW